MLVEPGNCAAFRALISACIDVCPGSPLGGRFLDCRRAGSGRLVAAIQDRPGG